MPLPAVKNPAAAETQCAVCIARGQVVHLAVRGLALPLARPARPTRVAWVPWKRGGRVIARGPPHRLGRPLVAPALVLRVPHRVRRVAGPRVARGLALLYRLRRVAVRMTVTARL